MFYNVRGETLNVIQNFHILLQKWVSELDILYISNWTWNIIFVSRLKFHSV